MIRRELLPEEVTEIAALATEFSDLRSIRPLIAELRERAKELGEVKLDGVLVRPTSVKDLIVLLEAKVVDVEWVKARLPGGGRTIDPAMEVKPIESRPAGNENADPSSIGSRAGGVLTLDRDYELKDKKVRVA